MHTEHPSTVAAIPPDPAVSPSPDNTRVQSRLRLATAAIFVTDLDRSVAFYQDLLGWDVTLTDDTVALLVSPDGFQVYLHSRGTRAQHPLGQIGIQYLIWTAADEDDLHRCVRLLTTRSSHVMSTTLDGFTVVEGRDPDQVPILVTYPGPEHAPRHQIMGRIYAW